MKNLFLAIIILISLNSCGDNNQNDFISGNLWRITSMEGIESYIFGTMHIYPKNELKISDRAFSHLKKCNTLALEFNLTDPIERKKIIDYRTLHPSSSNSRWVNALIAAYGQEELSSMEIQLIEVANEYGVNIIGLESADEILATLEESKGIEGSEQVITSEMIVHTLQEGFKMYREENIYDVKEKSETEEQLEINQRNENWLDNIYSSLERNETFIAVGMAHLGGNNGLLNLLQEKGYKLERIR